MDYIVHMTAFGQKEDVRVVTVPNEALEGLTDPEILDQIWKYGQNHIQPQNIQSLSVGDIIKLREHEYWKIMPSGFKQMTVKEFAEAEGRSVMDAYFGDES